MSKLATATANIRATAMGGLRTGLSSLREHQRAPVTVYMGAGPSTMPPTLHGIAPVQHPEPSNVNPTVAKVAAAQAAAQAAQLAAQRRRNQRASRKAATVAAAPVAPAKAKSFGDDYNARLAADAAKRRKAQAQRNRRAIAKAARMGLVMVDQGPLGWSCADPTSAATYAFGITPARALELLLEKMAAAK